MRLAELLAGLSAVADLGMGAPAGEAARTCVLAVGLAEAHGADAGAAYYTALLQHVGCTAYSYEASLLFGNEISIKQASMATDFARVSEIAMGYLPRIVREAPSGDRLRTLRSAVLRSRELTEGYRRANCEVAALVAGRLRLPDAVRQALLEVYEHFDGSGGPSRLRGDAISPASRIVNVAACAALFDRLGGPEAAVRAVRQRAGRALDPELCATFAARHRELLPVADDLSERLVASEPPPSRTITGSELDQVLQAFGETVDLKDPYLHGHSGEVARLTESICRSLGLTAEDVTLARRAALVHDLGRTAVPSRIWQRHDRLGADAWMQIRLHASYTEHILGRCGSLTELAPLAGMHHERLDGSGYHRTARAPQLPMTARALAVADVFQALTSDRPHRAALPTEAALAELAAEVAAGRLDGDAVAALGDHSSPRPSRPPQPNGLTPRQVDVLRLLARGMSNREIAAALVISPRTAEHHVQDVYLKLGTSSRAAAALHALHLGLLPESRVRRE